MLKRLRRKFSRKPKKTSKELEESYRKVSKSEQERMDQIMKCIDDHYNDTIFYMRE